MNKGSTFISASALLIAIVAASGAAFAGGDVIEGRNHRPHHRHHGVIVQRETYISHDFVAPAQLPPVGVGLHRGAFHGRYIGANYAYNPAYREVERSTAYGAQAQLDGIVHGSDSYNSIPYAAGYVGTYGGAAGYGVAAEGTSVAGGMIFEQNTTAAPAPVRGFRNEYRTRDAYAFNYDYESENPACWKAQYVAGQVRHVWSCPGGQ
ncbi:hypothetical protein ACVIGB_000896 [Bradyrhizobium sp. USDA 4341]